MSTSFGGNGLCAKNACATPPSPVCTCKKGPQTAATMQRTSFAHGGTVILTGSQWSARRVDHLSPQTIHLPSLPTTQHISINGLCRLYCTFVIRPTEDGTELQRLFADVSIPPCSVVCTNVIVDKHLCMLL